VTGAEPFSDLFGVAVKGIECLAFTAIIVGILGFWLIIPAFQKWWHTKKEWIFWLLLVVGCIVAYQLFAILIKLR